MLGNLAGNGSDENESVMSDSDMLVCALFGIGNGKAPDFKFEEKDFKFMCNEWITLSSLSFAVALDMRDVLMIPPDSWDAARAAGGKLVCAAVSECCVCV